ncbi:MAG: hypothetical protein R3B60_03775 [Candidatus Paceibacterota bacterium]
MTSFIYQKGVKVSLLVGVVVLLLVVAGVSGANAGYTFATGNYQDNNSKDKKTGLELTVESKAIYNGVLQPSLTWEAKNLVPKADKFFNFNDVKPGDLGEHLISLHVKKNDAYVCLDFSNLEDHENGTNEPEGLVDTEVGGELSQNLQFFAWQDDGDNKFEVGERIIFGTSTKTANVLLASTTYAVANTYSNSGNYCKAGSVNYVGILWCAGDLMVNTDTAEVNCDGKMMGNESQTDSMTVDVSLRAVQAKYNEGFSCDKKVPPQNYCKLKSKGNNGHGNDDDHNDDSNPGNSNDENDNTDDEGLPSGQIKYEALGQEYVDQNGKPCIPKGNNGHGNDDDHNDDSNPGNSNDENDNTDDDGLPSGQSENFYPVVVEENFFTKSIRDRFNSLFFRFDWNKNT